MALLYQQYVVPEEKSMYVLCIYIYMYMCICVTISVHVGQTSTVCCKPWVLSAGFLSGDKSGEYSTRSNFVGWNFCRSPIFTIFADPPALIFSLIFM